MEDITAQGENWSPDTQVRTIYQCTSNMVTSYVQFDVRCVSLHFKFDTIDVFNVDMAGAAELVWLVRFWLDHFFVILVPQNSVNNERSKMRRIHPKGYVRGSCAIIFQF